MVCRDSSGPSYDTSSFSAPPRSKNVTVIGWCPALSRIKPPARSKIPKKMWQWMHERVVWLTVGIRGKRTIKGCQNPNGGWRYGQAGGGEDLSSTQFVLLALRAASQAGWRGES